MELKPIGRIYTGFPEKFGIPRQSGIVSTRSVIVLEKEFRILEAVRGLEEYSHIWLIWQFSENADKGWSATVRPPRLGGNKRMGVFATRSPFRPNCLGLSSVRLIGIETDGEDAPRIIVEGADMTDATPIYDIKPYLRYTDCHEDAQCGFSEEVMGYSLKAEIPCGLSEGLSKEVLESLTQILENDPRPAYHDDPEREYKMTCLGLNVSFRVDKDKITATKIQRTVKK